MALTGDTCAKATAAVNGLSLLLADSSTHFSGNPVYQDLVRRPPTNELGQLAPVRLGLQADRC